MSAYLTPSLSDGDSYAHCEPSVQLMIAHVAKSHYLDPDPHVSGDPQPRRADAAYRRVVRGQPLPHDRGLMEAISFALQELRMGEERHALLDELFSDDAPSWNWTITIDGPAGAGKTTAARRLAQARGIRHLDTGLIYRVIAQRTLTRANRSIHQSQDAASVATSLSFSFDDACPPSGLICNGDEIDSAELRTDDLSDAASTVASYEAVRSAVLDCQRTLADSACCVIEGRDIGTVVCPDAELKVFLTASIDERARRRYGEGVMSSELQDKALERIQTRDERDRSREHAPLQRPDEAIEVDTTDETPEETVDHLERLIDEHIF